MCAPLDLAFYCNTSVPGINNRKRWKSVFNLRSNVSSWFGGENVG